MWPKQQSSRIASASVIDTSTASALSAAFGSQTRQVRLWGNAAHYVLFSPSTAATVSSANGTPLSSGQAEYFQVSPGEMAVAATSTSTGQLWVTEMT